MLLVTARIRELEGSYKRGTRRVRGYRVFFRRVRKRREPGLSSLKYLECREGVHFHYFIQFIDKNHSYDKKYDSILKQSTMKINSLREKSCNFI